VDYAANVLGTYLSQRLATRYTGVILSIGRDHYTRGDLARVGCYHFLAAQTLSAILPEHVDVADTRDLYEHVSPSDLMVKRVGAIAVAVLGAAFEARGLGGKHPLGSWFERHNLDTTVDTLKQHHKSAAESGPAAPTRKRPRRR